MTIVYQPSLDPVHYQTRFQIDTLSVQSSVLRPADDGVFVRRPRPDRAGLRPEARFEIARGRWGLIPLFASAREYPSTYEARVETAPVERDFYQPWKRGHRCVVLADALFRHADAGRRVVRVARADGAPLALAGLWNAWRSPDGQCVESFTLLTLPSEEQPGERRIVFLRDGWIDDWLNCPVEEAATCLRPYDLHKLVRTEVDALPQFAGAESIPAIDGAPPNLATSCAA